MIQPTLSHLGLGLATVIVVLIVVAPGLLVGVILGEAELGITLSAAIAGTVALAGNLRRQAGHAL